jgi:hypothetical protein
MKQAIILVLLIPVLAFGQAGKKKSFKLLSVAKMALKLQMKLGKGTNGSAVVYHPEKRVYCAVIAGNSTFPLEMFDDKGEHFYTQEAGWDARGMWYNPQTDELQGNSYEGEKIVSFALDVMGVPMDEMSTIVEYPEQPEANCVSAFDAESQYVYNLDGLTIPYYSLEGGMTVDTLYLSNVPNNGDWLNTTTVIFTGAAGMELGVLNYSKKEVYFFDKSTGKFAAKIKLPKTAVTNEVFRFSYANKMIFLYDVKTRTWTGYKIFK